MPMAEYGELMRHSNVKKRLERLRKLQNKVKNLRRFHSDFENKEFLEWTAMSHDDINYDKLLVKGAGHVTQLVDWCNTHCKDFYVAYQGKLYFKNDTDAAYFTMVWK
jgi:hypothetical protein